MTEPPPSHLSLHADLLLIHVPCGLCRAAAEERASVGAAAGADEEAVGREHAAHATHRRHARSVGPHTYHFTPSSIPKPRSAFLYLSHFPPSTPERTTSQLTSLCLATWQVGRARASLVPVARTAARSSRLWAQGGHHTPPKIDKVRPILKLNHIQHIMTWRGASQMNHTCLLNGWVGV